MFITFEGPEGGGKSTQIRMLSAVLESAGHSLVLTREPGGTTTGNKIRQIVLEDVSLQIEPLTEFLLYSASRSQLVREVIRPALQEGHVVLCDRYFDSSLAYQGYGRGLDLRFLQDVTWEATGGLRPHLTFLMDLPPKVGLERAAARGQFDRLEQADLQFHERVREGFLNLAAAEPERFYVVDATRTPEEIHTEILQIVQSTLIFKF
ncbi:dTMP kinase [Deinococcus cellulosilyticus]|uniref:Thymidylate kinase n=1 Tax=Deinococcus cellulosilyticus (strain DSM 18568 / NBRC 106333 / KACC 11606 / 5516J-15) TaxID=1223518 RepID=A0A511N5P8_DEIC1|nr:dTMP kinase [Deinococcus cellulosilyticus]GEM48190.1 thymidylate kinase [Deinococcus cellulosilyticus NBRC 106333 = KACC 11606]